MGTAIVLFGRDPDGNVFELLQPARPALRPADTSGHDAWGQTVAAARTAWRQRLAAGSGA
ncbi:hypothetical protein CHU93_07665 [Sandarakinorhabdus cyanobacteriorum]|uniref:Uncharacterized protein n=1 Tax=Sandarakinorhabdus cyanobacteriorum TaxID=1981098 RepID=A0A255YJL8_9SPHN|nr:hypothetical protein [Sandarakinorhabdus cyanobacteriorum]OYQ29369.1 hypothetical protein CHU93_07665 [Sandarakinorhabdus cyanobacteriorum]